MTIEYDENNLTVSKIIEPMRVAGKKMASVLSHEENEELLNHLTQAVSETQNIISGKTEGIGLETLLAEI